jgi:site-specific DNA recombinase
LKCHARSYGAKYLFSGFLKCGLCGSNVVLISGRGGAGSAKYGCPLHQNRGICANDLVVRRDALERELISGLQREVLHEDVAAFAIEEFRRQLHARLESARSQLGTLRNRRERLKAEIANLTTAIAEGHASAALMAELAKRERELDGISEQLLATNGTGLDAKLQEIQQFVQKRLQDVRGLLFADVPRAKAELSKHCTAITLTPTDSGYQVSGNWDLLGGRLDGAGGQNRTGYARLFRAALYQ